MAEHAARERLLASERLKLRRDFLRVSGGGHKVHSARFLFLVLPRGDEGPSRLGITVTRKVANAVGRNRIKRVLREVFRRNRAFFPSGCDVVAIAKDRAPGLAYEDARTEVETAARSLHRAAGRPPRPQTHRPEAPERAKKTAKDEPAQTAGPRNQKKEAPVRGSETRSGPEASERRR